MWQLFDNSGLDFKPELATSKLATSMVANYGQFRLP